MLSRPVKFASVLAVVVALVPCFANAAPSPFSDVPSDDATFADIAALRADGALAVTGDASSSRPAVTRYEIVTMIAPLRDRLINPQSFTSPIPVGHLGLVGDLAWQPSLLRSVYTLKLLDRLSVEFAPELTKLGWDMTLMAKEFALLESDAQRASRGPFADVPNNHEAYTLVERLREDGAYKSFWSGGSRWPLTRTEFAMMIDTARPALANPSKFSIPLIVQLWRDAAPSGQWTPKVIQNPHSLVTLESLASLFPLELAVLGWDKDAMHAQFAMLERDASPFADVPAAHWAAGDVQRLRVDQIIVGYPDGSFTAGDKS